MLFGLSRFVDNSTFFIVMYLDLLCDTDTPLLHIVILNWDRCAEKTDRGWKG